MKHSVIIFSVLSIAMIVCSLVALAAHIQYMFAYSGMSMVPPAIESTPYAYGYPFVVGFCLFACLLVFFEFGRYVGGKEKHGESVTP